MWAEPFVLFFLLVMSDVPEEEEMARYWYRKEKETEAGLRLGCVRITEMKGMMSFLESESYSLPYLPIGTNQGVDS